MNRRDFLKLGGASLAGLAALAVTARPARADTEPYVGEIAIFPYNFVPQGWSYCEGQLLPITSNTALYALLGTRFGGNGTSNFALPDMRSTTTLGFHTGLEFSNLRYCIALQGIYPPRP